MNDNNDSQANAQTEARAQDAERQDDSNGTPERRERRSRDRYGRDRRERNNNTDNNTDTAAGENQAAEISANAGQTQDEAPVTRSYFDRAASSASPASSTANSGSETAQTSKSAQAAPSSVPESKSAAKAPTAGLPKVQAFELPIASLIQVAEGSGLQWVNSDREKIAQVQAAIAAEPKPVHVPRERPPAVILYEGPFVLVETRNDLSYMKLPF